MTTFEEFMHRIKLPRGHIFIPELLKLVAKLPSQKERVAALQAYAGRTPVYEQSLKFMVQCLYHPEVIFDLPATDPVYKPLDAVDESQAFVTLLTELKNIRRFCFCPAKIENAIVRERVFVQTLEKLSPREAKLLLMIKNKKLDKRVYPGVDEKLFRAAFPTWLPETATKNAQTPA